VSQPYVTACPLDVQRCGVMLVFLYRTNYTQQILVREASSFPASQESPAFCVSWEFITVFTKASHFSMIDSDEFSPHCPMLLRKNFNIVSPFTPRSSKLSTGFATKSVYALLSYTVYVPCPSNPCIDKQYKSCSTSLCSIPQTPVTVFLLCLGTSWPPCAGTPRNSSSLHVQTVIKQ
jgi:hypothetical protein